MIQPLAKSETNAEYHANPAIGKSMLWEFRKRKMLYKRRYIEKLLAPMKPSKEMQLGTLVHTLFLEPDTFAANYYELPAEFVTDKGEISTAKKAVEFIAANAGKTPYTQEQLGKAVRMVDSMREQVKPWLRFQRENEKSIYWTDEETRLPMKCRPDWLILAGETAICIDVKTTQNVSKRAFRDACIEYGYHIQQAHYSEGIRAGHGVQSVEWRFLVVESNEPFEAHIYPLSYKTMVRAHDQLRTIRHTLAEAIANDDWQLEYTENEIDLPEYAFEL